MDKLEITKPLFFFHKLNWNKVMDELRIISLFYFQVLSRNGTFPFCPNKNLEITSLSLDIKINKTQSLLLYCQNFM